MWRWTIIIVWISLSVGATAQMHDCSGFSPRNNLRFTTTDVNLRAYSSTNADVLVTLPKGEKVFAYYEANGWSQVNVASLNITGYVASRFLSESCVAGGGLSRALLTNAAITKVLMSQSLSRYGGSCPCPYNYDRAGRRCGRRSAYSRPGGASPLCYSGDVTSDLIERFKGTR